jgi:hypothetical protein
MMIFLVSKKTGRFEHYCSTKPSLCFEVPKLCWQTNLLYSMSNFLSLSVVKNLLFGLLLVGGVPACL